MQNRISLKAVRKITDFFTSTRPKQVQTRDKRPIDITSTQLKILQLNSQKKITSMDALDKLSKNSDLFIILGSEPSAPKGYINGLTGKHTKVHTTDHFPLQPRAYICAHKRLDVWPVTELCSRDFSTVMLDTHIPGNKRYLIQSVYWWNPPVNSDHNIPKEILGAIKMAKDQGLKLLISGDFNAHNQIWGDKELDTRGQNVEDLIIRENLSLENRGYLPTYQTQVASRNIDLTITNDAMKNEVKNWTVTREMVHSDHKLITYNLSIPKKEEVYIQDLNTLKLDLMSAEIETEVKKLSQKLPERWSTKTMENTLDTFYKIVDTAITNNSDKKKDTTRDPPVKWRTPEVKAQRQIVRTKLHIWQKNRSEENREAWKKEEYLYNDICKHAKRNQSEKEAAACDSPKDLVDLIKRLEKHSNNEIGLLKKPNGILATTPEESIKILCDTHFYQSKDNTGQNQTVQTKQI